MGGGRKSGRGTLIFRYKKASHQKAKCAKFQSRTSNFVAFMTFLFLNIPKNTLCGINFRTF